jgi:uncharacterized cupredoxin-like copper-binding protein
MTMSMGPRFGALLAAGAALVLLASCGGSNDSSTGGSGSGSANASGSSTAASGGGYGSGGGGGSSTSAQSSPTSSSGGRALTVKAEEANGFSFSSKALHAQAGKVTLKLVNGTGNAAPHGIAVEGGGVHAGGQVVQPGGTSAVTVDLKPGTYTFYCPVPGHRQAGMQGTLTIG